MILITILTYLLEIFVQLINQTYYFLYDFLDKVQISPYFIVGYIVVNEVVGISCITIDFILEDVIKPKNRIKMTKYEDF